MNGIYRYVRLPDVADRMADGWRWRADMGPVHGRWSALMWWCCGDCADGEAP
jgi:hypothetical protein